MSADKKTQSIEPDQGEMLKHARNMAGELIGQLEKIGPHVDGETFKEELEAWERDFRLIKHHYSGDEDALEKAFKSAGDKKLYERVLAPRRALLTHMGRSHEGELAIPLGELALLVGEGGIGKSWALLQLAISIVTGRSWLGFKVPADAIGGVAVIMAEEDEDELARRVRTISDRLNLAAHERSMVDARLFPMGLVGKAPELVAPTDEGSVIEGSGFYKLEELLTTRAPEGGWRLIIFDPLVKFLPPGAESDNVLASGFVDVIATWPKTLPGCPTLLMAHHTNKQSRKGLGGSASAARGASSLTDSFRCQVNIWTEEREKETPEDAAIEDILIAITKSNYGPKGTPQKLVRIEQGMFGLAGSAREEAQDHRTSTQTTKRELPW